MRKKPKNDLSPIKWFKFPASFYFLSARSRKFKTLYHSIDIDNHTEFIKNTVHSIFIIQIWETFSGFFFRRLYLTQVSVDATSNCKLSCSTQSKIYIANVDIGSQYRS